MPIWSYTCTGEGCKYQFDDIAPYPPLDTKVCPNCGGIARKDSVYSVGTNGQMMTFGRTN